MRQDSNERGDWSHLAWGIGGLVLGSWAARSRIEQAKKSRAEIDDPQQASEVYDEIGMLLDEWEPESDYQGEMDLVQDLGDWLGTNSDWEVEVCPSTREGRPDIVIGNLLALELKVEPRKTELDRCVGQCAAYSRQWITWIVLVDAAASAVGRLEDLLGDKGLDHLEVWSFP